MSTITLIQGSCPEQQADAIVNAANPQLLAGGGVCGAIFRKAGLRELTDACRRCPTPVADGAAVLTPAFGITNARAIIHAVGPNFAVTPNAFSKLYDAYYNSLLLLKANGFHSIAFPLISSGIYGGSLPRPAHESAKQCLLAYHSFVRVFPEYDISVCLCAFSAAEYSEALAAFRSE